MNAKLIKICTEFFNCSFCDAQGKSCNSSAGQSCLSCCGGWEGQLCDTDADECARNSTLCHYVNSYCDNTPGSYVCKCKAGYFLINGSLGSGANGTCKDIDECKVGTALCTHECSNTDGGYKCTCPLGFVLHNNHTCRDLDECRDSSMCPSQAVCNNTDGSFTCTCPVGYNYNRNNYTCDNVNECATDSSICLNSVCKDVPGSFQCDCDPGYNFFNKTYCKDINECRSNQPPCPNMGCINNPGGYTCTCPYGWTYEKTANICIKEPWNPCQQICGHDPNSGISGMCVCECLSGYTVDSSNGSLCLDLDECTAHPGICGKRICINTPRSYHCLCPRGYENDWTNSGKCIDINECENPLIANQCTGKLFRECHNLDGTYNCSCRHGYEEDRGVCTQIDECTRGTSGCEYFCEDIAGGFRCSCPFDQELDSDGLNCSLIECGSPSLDNCKTNEPDCTAVTAVCNDTDYYLNSKCLLGCDESLGYYLDGPAEIQCTDRSVWDDNTSKCLCSDKEVVTLASYEIMEPVGKADVQIPIIMKVPKCKTHNTAHIITIPTYKFYPPFFIPLWVTGDNLVVNKALYSLIVAPLSTANDRKNITFKMIVTHPDKKLVDEREVSLTVKNTPQPPVVPSTSVTVSLQSYLTEKKTQISVLEYDEDGVSCTFNDAMLGVDLLLTKPSPPIVRLKYTVVIKVLNGTFKDVKEIRNNGTSPYLFSKNLECVDDSPQRLRSSTLINITFNINDYIVSINRIQVEPNTTILDQVQARFEIRAFGFFINPANTRLTRAQIAQDDTIDEEVESTTFEIEVRAFKDNFKVKGRTLQYVKQVDSPGIYDIPIMITNTKSHDPAKEYNATIEIRGFETSDSILLPASIAVSAVVVLGVIILIASRICQIGKPLPEKKDSFRLNPLYSQELQSYYVNMDNLKIYFDKTLGCGHFGVVYLGSARRLKNSQRRGFGEEEWLKVAVKELKNMDKLPYSEAFHKEVKALTTYKHRNIISLLGIGLCEGQHRYIIMDHMDEGSLKQFLCTLKTSENEKSQLGDQHFIFMAAQVADAMTFMERWSAIHRDLAARNCLVNSKLLVKVADLGSATSLHSDSGSLCDYYQIGQKAIPVRWTSPEVLNTLKHSIASDVWSFGILFWEILSLCERPYGEFASDGEVIEAIKCGKKLEVPQKYQGGISNLIQSCWEMQPEKRPSFSDIFAQLQGFLMSMYKVAYTEKKDQLEVDIGML